MSENEQQDEQQEKYELYAAQCLNDIDKLLVDIEPAFKKIIDMYCKALPMYNEKKHFLDIMRYSKPSLRPENVPHNLSLDIYSLANSIFYDEEMDKYIHCDECDSYTEESDWKTENAKETSVECVYVDSGYGDDDTFADVTRLNTYKLCPNCGTKKLVNSMYLGEKNSRTRK